MGWCDGWMRSGLGIIAMVAVLAGCAPDTANRPVVLPAPYDAWPAAPPGHRIEPGMPVGLDNRQQEAVIMSVLRWMKDPASVQFASINAARNARGLITVCGLVNGRNSAGRFVGMSPFIGVLVGQDSDSDFVVVGIGSSERERSEVTSLCKASGI